MAETRVENRVCQACEADVRPGSLFCYNCGSSVAPNLAVETEDVNQYETGKLSLNGNIEKDKNSAKYVETVDKPIEKPSGLPVEKNAEDKKISSQEQNKIKASAVRQKSRNIEKKTVEVVWEKPESSTSIWFLVASIILILFAVGILLAALYIR